MKYWLLICILLCSMLIFCWFSYRRYDRRYKKCLNSIDEAILDIIKAVRIIMDGCDAEQIDNVVIETIEKNIIIQRAFSEHKLIYIHEVSRKWIKKRTKQVKNKHML